MSDPRTLASAYGVRIELDDLGSWTPAMLVSEYDPDGPVIRVNRRAIERLHATFGEQTSSCDVRTLIDVAIAHELYHHREHLGEVDRLPTHAEREAAADAYARAQVPLDTNLAAFLSGARR